MHEYFFSFLHECPVCGFLVDEGCANGLCLNCADRFYDLTRSDALPMSSDDYKFYKKCYLVHEKYLKAVKSLESKDKT